LARALSLFSSSVRGLALACALFFSAFARSRILFLLALSFFFAIESFFFGLPEGRFEFTRIEKDGRLEERRIFLMKSYPPSGLKTVFIIAQVKKMGDCACAQPPGKRWWDRERRGSQTLAFLPPH